MPDGFLGEFDPVTVRSVFEPLVVSGGDMDGAAFGESAIAIINGRDVTSDSLRFELTEGGHPVAIEFQSGFVGRVSAGRSGRRQPVR